MSMIEGRASYVTDRTDISHLLDIVSATASASSSTTRPHQGARPAVSLNVNDIEVPRSVTGVNFICCRCS